MPVSVKPLGGAIKHEDTIEISWRFEANLSDLPPKGFDLEAPASVPLPGSWELSIANDKDTPDKLIVDVSYGSLSVGRFGKSVAVELQFALVVGAQTRQLDKEAWRSEPEPSLDLKTYRVCDAYRLTMSRSRLAANGSWSTSEQNSARQYRCTLILRRDLRLDTAHSHHTPIADATKAQRLADSFHTRHADVCLRFRRSDDVCLELWTTSGSLTTASDYYKTLFASGCAETVPSCSKRQRSEAPPPVKHEGSGKSSPEKPAIDWLDSDDETDDFLVERDWSGCKTASRDSVDLEYQQIDVRETAYSTMNAVLLYLATGHIEFAPLNSLLETRSQGNSGGRRTLLDKHVSKHPTLPPPVSPKSVYRLAHLLQREELQQLALDSLSSGLSIEGARRELFSPVSIAYADVRKIILDYVVKNWEKVQASESWNELSEKAMAGEIEGAAQISFVLLRALHGKDPLGAAPEKLA